MIYLLFNTGLPDENIDKNWFFYLKVSTSCLILTADFIQHLFVYLLNLHKATEQCIFNAFADEVKENATGVKITLTLAEEVTFLNKAAIQKVLYGLPRRINGNSIDGSQSRFIDKDVIEVIKNFEQNAPSKGKSDRTDQHPE